MAQLEAGPRAIEIEFERPPLLTNQEGRPRGVGVEIEFSGLTAEAAARTLAEALGGHVVHKDPHRFLVEASEIGDLEVELDSRYAHPEKMDQSSLLGRVEAKLSEWFGAAASLVVPCELVTGPVPIERLSEVQRAIDVLRQAGATGTQDGALYAFGLHFNPEAPRLDAETIGAILKAFVLLNAWLRREVAPDTTRYLLGFADPFPDDYVRWIAAPDYWPDLGRFIDDYLDANPTRNRDLDLLPLLTFIDEERVRTRLPQEKIGKRPAFHYRLPDARISDPGWQIAPDWNRWVAVERIAADRDRLAQLGLAYLVFEGETKSWADVAQRIAFA
ncbi:MAG: amidoligase family protein [Pseudomonadota bacterium]|nr:amidoligase family protein [Pseudomonadota bacterium]